MDTLLPMNVTGYYKNSFYTTDSNSSNIYLCNADLESVETEPELTELHEKTLDMISGTKTI